jgi:small multidrug resistance pump
MPGYVWLAIAIVAEVIGTSALRASEGFSRLWPSLVVVAGYGVAFYCLSMTLKSMPVGIVLYRQVPDLAAVAGLGLIIAGVVVLNLFSKMQAH